MSILINNMRFPIIIIDDIYRDIKNRSKYIYCQNMFRRSNTVPSFCKEPAVKNVHGCIFLTRWLQPAFTPFIRAEGLIPRRLRRGC